MKKWPTTKAFRFREDAEKRQIIAELWIYIPFHCYQMERLQQERQMVHNDQNHMAKMH